MFTLDQVVPWGRSFAEYRRMFALSDGDLERRILGCADGPASFNAECAAAGCRVVSVDPIYKWTTRQIRERIAATSADVLEQTRRNQDEFVWTEFASVEALAAARARAMNAFTADFDASRGAGRYVAAGLPALPFPDASFDIAVCSHFLFLYTAQTSEQFHLDSIDELCRIAGDVRIFPLLALGATPSPYVDAVVDHVNRAGLNAAIETVPYEFQRGGNQMLRVTGAGRAGRAGGPGRAGRASFIVRRATADDVPVLQRLIEQSARALSVGFYTETEIEAAIRHVFGVDSRLIADGTYFVVEDDSEIVGCGGWSRRRTLYGGDQRPVGGSDLLNPATDAARIRAFFVAPRHARRGIGRQILDACIAAATAAQFTRLELMATLPGVPLYATCGFHAVEEITDVLPDGTPLRFVRMQRPIDHFVHASARGDGPDK